MKKIPVVLESYLKTSQGLATANQAKLETASSFAATQGRRGVFMPMIKQC